MINELRQLKNQLAPLMALATAVWYVSHIFSAIDIRMDKLQYNIDKILYQVTASAELQDAKLSAREDLLDEKIKSCGCYKKPAQPLQ